MNQYSRIWSWILALGLMLLNVACSTQPNTLPPPTMSSDSGGTMGDTGGDMGSGGTNTGNSDDPNPSTLVAGSSVEGDGTTCLVDVSPVPDGLGCELDPRLDQDPNLLGYQAQIRVQSLNCSSIRYNVNGIQSAPFVIGDDNESRTIDHIVNLPDGENTVEVIVSATEADFERTGTQYTSTVTSYTYNVSLSVPSFTLTEMDINRASNAFDATAANAEASANGVSWRFTGQATGIAPGSAVSVRFDPPLDAANPDAISITPADDGSFSLDVNVPNQDENNTGRYEGRIILGGVDPCGRTFVNDGLAANANNFPIPNPPAYAVDLVARYCDVSVTPQSDNLGCGLDPREDQAPAISGYQALLVATSQNCSDVEFGVGSAELVSTTIDETSRTATHIANLQSENTAVEVTVSGPGYTNQVVDIQLVAPPQTPSLTLARVGGNALNSDGPNVFGAAQGTEDENATTWDLSGQAAGIATGSTINAIFRPAFETPDDALSESVVEITPDETGAFTVSVTVQNAPAPAGDGTGGTDSDGAGGANAQPAADDSNSGIYEGTITLSGRDACGVEYITDGTAARGVVYGGPAIEDPAVAARSGNPNPYNVSFNTTASCTLGMLLPTEIPEAAVDGDCRVHPAYDSNTSRDGVQVNLRADTDCFDGLVAGVDDFHVAISINGGEFVNYTNIAQIPMDVIDGLNTVDARAVRRNPDNGNELEVAFIAPTFTFAATTANPNFLMNQLSANRPTTLGLSDGQQVSVGGVDRVFWSLSGNATGLSQGQRLNLQFDPALPGIQSTQAVTDGLGNFNVEVSVPRDGVYPATDQGQFYGTVKPILAVNNGVCSYTYDDAPYTDAYEVRLDGRDDCTLDISGDVDTFACDRDGDASNGTQVIITAVTNCEDIQWTLNDESVVPTKLDDQDAEAGLIERLQRTERYEFTLQDPSNVIEAVGREGGVPTTQSQPISLETPSQPALTLNGLNPRLQNALTLADGVTVGAEVIWTLGGTVNGFDSGTPLTVILDDDDANAQNLTIPDVAPDETGAFSFEVRLATDLFRSGRLQVQGKTICGQNLTLPDPDTATAEQDYDVSFDPVTPVLTVTSPAEDNILVSRADDAFPRAGLQIPFEVKLRDPRPAAVDYDVIIECGVVGSTTVLNKSTSTGDARNRSDFVETQLESDILTATVYATFQDAETGAFACSPAITQTTNPEVALNAVGLQRATNIQVFTSTPTFNVDGSGLTCTNAQTINLNGNLTGGDGATNIGLFAKITQIRDANGSDIEPRELSRDNLFLAGPNDSYSLALDLNDGGYEIDVTGGAFNGVLPIKVACSGIDCAPSNDNPNGMVFEMTVDRLAPGISIVEPAVDNNGQTIFADSNVASGIQAAVQVEICNAAGGTVTMTSPDDSNVSGQLTAPSPAGVTGTSTQAGCDRVTFDAFSVNPGSTTLDVTAADACGNSTSATVTAETPPLCAVGEDPTVTPCTPPLAILGPRGTVLARDDVDANRNGCQANLRARIVNIPSTAQFAVCTTNGGSAGRASPLCINIGGQPSANVLRGECDEEFSAIGGSTIVSCPIDLPKGDHELEFVARYNNQFYRVSGETLTADCVAPTIDALSAAALGGDDCLNLAEKSDAVQIAIDANISDFESDQSLTLKRGDGQTLSTTQAGATGTVTMNVDICGNDGQSNCLADGNTYTLFVEGSDSAGNPAATNTANNALVVSVDLTSPVPSIGALPGDAATTANGTCLGSQHDKDITSPDTVDHDFTVQSGRQVAEDVTMVLTITEELAFQAPIVNNGENADSATFRAALGQGTYDALLTVTDRCGNEGSATQSLYVDSISPVLTFENFPLAPLTQRNDDGLADYSLDLVVDDIEANQSFTIFRNSNAADVAASGTWAVDGPTRETLSLSAANGPAFILSGQSQDACGNIGQTAAPISIDVDTGGCASTITSHATGFYGRAAQDASGTPIPLNVTDAGSEVLSFNIEGQVVVQDGEELLTNCINTAAVLLNDANQELARIDSIPANGAVQFAPVALAEGRHDLRLVIGDNPQIDLNDASPTYTYTVDLTTPRIQVNSPASGSAISSQPLPITLQVDEGVITTSRTIDVNFGGDQDVSGAALENGNLEVFQVDVTENSSGTKVLIACVEDQAGNRSCNNDDGSTHEVNLDIEAPGQISDFAAEIVNRRSTEVRLSWTAVADDGTNAVSGPVAAYQLRTSNAPLTDANFDNAAVDLTIDANAGSNPFGLVLANAGDPMNFTVTGFGPGRSFIDGFQPNELHYVGIRATDEVGGRAGPVTNIAVDLRLRTREFTLTAVGNEGRWTDGIIRPAGKTMHALGDIDGDGFDDLVVGTNDQNAPNPYAAGIIFGAEDLANAQLVPLTFETNENRFSAFRVAALNDINGDGAPDFGIYSLTNAFTARIDLFFGCAPTADTPCDRQTIATSNHVISIEDTAVASMTGVGNFINMVDDLTSFDDILFGYLISDDSKAVAIAGRSNWPAVLTVNPNTGGDGVVFIEAENANVAALATFGGRINNDQLDDVVFDTGFGSSLYIFYGQDNVSSGATLAYANTADYDFVNLPACLGGNAFSSLASGSNVAGGAGNDFAIGNSQNFERRIIVFDETLSATDCFDIDQRDMPYVIEMGADFNGDGFPDIIANHIRPDDATTANDESGFNYVFFNDGNGCFGANVAYTPTGDCFDSTSTVPEVRSPNVYLAGNGVSEQVIAAAGDLDGSTKADPASAPQYRDDIAIIFKETVDGVVNVKVVIYY